MQGWFLVLLLVVKSCETYRLARSGQRPVASLSCIVNHDIMLFNTLTRKKELFVPINPPLVSFYTCGPTVYDYAHIGNFRAFLTYDVIKRWLQYNNYDVDHVCNLTDVDDKIIIKMIAENKSLREITEKYTNAFFDDLNVLNIIRARAYPKATEHITDIEEMIQKLVDRGHAYIENNSVYFKVSSFPTYGQLANIKFDEVIDGAGDSGPNARRGGSDEKQSNRDFALWKAVTIQDGDVQWDTGFGRGRPGWHIECSAMCYKLLGPTIDIHAGGIDLVFPHHQNEIAQTEAFTGQQFSKYWLHNGFVNINNEKMSKSLKNFKTLRDIVTKPSDARAFRFLIVSAQYRNPLNFTPETFQAAINSLKRIDKLVGRLNDFIKSIGSTSFGDSKHINDDDGNDDNGGVLHEHKVVINSIIALFEAAMCDDLNTPKAVAALFKLISEAENVIKRQQMCKSIAALYLDGIKQMDQVFGVLYEVSADYFDESCSSSSSTTTDRRKGNNNNNDGVVTSQYKSLENAKFGSNPMHPIDCECESEDIVISKVKHLASQRVDFKTKKMYKEADKIREEIIALGYGIKDVKDNADGYEIFVL